MLLRLFRKPTLHDADPRRRRAAIEALVGEDAQERAQLAEIAQRDPVAECRRSAVKRLFDLALLRRCAQEDGDAGVRAVAAARYRQLLAGRGEAVELADRLAEIRRCGDEALLAHLARRGRETEVRAAALEKIADSGVLEDVAVNDTVATLRQLAIRRLEQPEVLERLERALRRRDKRLARLARERCEQLRQSVALEQARQAEYRRLADSMQSLAQAQIDTGYRAAVERLENLWRAVGSVAGDATEQAFMEAMAVARRRWSEAAAAPPASMAVESVQEAPLPESAPEAAEVAQPPARQQADPAADEQAAPSEAEAKTALRLATREFQRVLRALANALERGELRRAQAELRRARGLLSGLSQEQAQKLRPYAERIRELRDWRRFVTLPKQEELCARMEALIDSDLDPPERARQIKALQQEWEATGGSDSGAGRRLWMRFCTAQEKAFEPCKAYFEEQRRLRTTNLSLRREVVEQLEAFLARPDWAEAGAQFLVKVRQQARQEWQAAIPVERSKVAPLQRRFDTAMATISSRIDSLSAERRARRESLLAEAQIAAQGDLATALPRIKELQRQWQQLGPPGTAAERRLTGRFRAVCAQVFQQRAEQRTQREREQAQRQGEAQTLVEAAQALLERPAGELATALQECKGLRHALEGLGLPRQAQEAPKRAIAQVEAQLRARGEELQRRREEEELAALARMGALCQRLEALLGLAQAQEALPELQTAWEAEMQLPVDLAAPVAARWQTLCALAAAGAALPEDELRTNVEQARRLCVHMEILAGLPSEEDEELRLDLQVQRLAAGLGARDHVDRREQVRALLAEWYGLSLGEAAAVLQQRLQTAAAAAMRV